MLGLAFYGLINGNVLKLIGPVDGDHNICGADSGFTDYKHLYISDLEGGTSDFSDIFKSGICVKDCPKKDGKAIECKPTTDVPDCNSAAVKAKEYETIDVAGYCMPKSLDTLPKEYRTGWDNVVQKFKESQAGQLINDMKVAKTGVFICLGMGFVYSILYIYALSRFANCLAKFSVLVIELGFIGGIGASIMMSKNASSKSGYYIAAGVVGLMFLMFNMMLWCFYKQFKVAIAVVDATADFFAATKRIVLVSVIYFFVTLIVIVVWFAAFGCTLSLNTITADPTKVQGKNIEWKSSVTGMLIFMVVGLVWLVFFIQDKTGFICMVSACTYYFSSNKDKEGSASVFTGVKYAYFKHAGSLAFGSLIHAIVTIIKWLVDFAADQA